MKIQEEVACLAECAFVIIARAAPFHMNGYKPGRYGLSQVFKTGRRLGECTRLFKHSNEITITVC